MFSMHTPKELHIEVLRNSEDIRHAFIEKYADHYEAIGYSEALYYHAVIAGKHGGGDSAEPNWDTATMTIERVNQSVTTTVVYKGVTYTNTYYDFDFLATDTEYMYIGMSANRGTVVEFTDVVFTQLGNSQSA